MFTMRLYCTGTLYTFSYTVSTNVVLYQHTIHIQLYSVDQSVVGCGAPPQSCTRASHSRETVLEIYVVGSVGHGVQWDTVN